VTEILQPCGDVEGLENLVVKYSVPKGLANKYPSVALPIIQERLISLNPVLVITGSCAFVSKYYKDLKDFTVQIGNNSRKISFNQMRSFPLVLGQREASCSFRDKDTCGPVVDNMTRMFGFLLSWFSNWNWGDIILVHDELVHEKILSTLGDYFGYWSYFLKLPHPYPTKRIKVIFIF